MSDQSEDLARREVDVAGLRAALAAGDFESIDRDGARAETMAREYGLQDLADAARELQQAALRRDSLAATGAIASFERVLSSLGRVEPRSGGLRVAVLEDDPLQLALACGWLEKAGHACHGFSSAAPLMKELGRETFDVVVLDWMMPGPSGEAVLRWIRSSFPRRVPVVFATARDDESEIVDMLGLGADDYLVKPLRPREFVARLEAVARRHRTGSPARTLEAGPYRYEPEGRIVTLDGRAVPMTPRMVEVVRFLLERPETLVSRGQLYELVWQRPLVAGTRTIDTHMSRIRRVLELDGRHGWRLTSVYQQGYRLERARLHL